MKLRQRLVGGAITILKNMSSSVGKDDIPYMMENQKMFETTNQNMSTVHVLSPP